MITLTGLEDSPAAAITEADVAGFAAKLEAWYETLPPGEQAVLQRLLACAEGMASEECEVAGYALPGIGARLTRLFAAGLIAATLAAPLAASAAGSVSVPVNSGVVLTDPRTPEEHIRAKALALGADFTGSALSGLETVPNGFRVRYQKCDIYYSTATGSREVHGDIRAKYNTLGGPSSALGLPATDELTNSDGIGRHNEFSKNASIYWSPNTGPFAISGQMRSLWVGQGAENSRFGYPTSGLQSVNGGQWTDFQNDVIYLEGTTLRATENVEMTRAQLAKALHSRIEAGFYGFDEFAVEIDSFSIRGVSDTGYGFSQSRNRRVKVHIEGTVRVPKPFPRFDSHPHYTIDLEFDFLPQKEADGSTSLCMKLVDNYRETLTIDHNHRADVDEFFVDNIVHRFLAFHQGPPAPLKLIDVTIPAAVPVLSFKVLEDGRIKLFMKPGDGSSVVQLAVQLEFDRLAK